MKTELTIRIEASNLDELQEALATLQLSLNRTGSAATDLAIHTDAPGTATIAVAPKAAKAKSKKAEKEPELEPEQQQQQQPEPQPEPEAATPDEGHPEPAPDTVGQLTPAEARQKGIDEMQKFFGQNNGAMTQIKELQRKYGVRLFSEIPDNRAHEFYADAKLLVSGSAEAAA